ncbi:unnamed protein product [Staurois parvus]|uniref:Uncharacterized protein n=1 Tax=Staurois parvus TaxID=386267 RepID=A0ABN9GV30_9NEOB|nr:unnamed protein product [Staurois parvus]
MGPLCLYPNSKKPKKKVPGASHGTPYCPWAHKIPDMIIPPGRLKNSIDQGRTDNSWGPRAIEDHGAPVSLPTLKKAYEKVPGASHGAPY